jgi:penicillin-binding protein 1A
LVVLGLLGLASFTYGLMTAIASQIPSLDPSLNASRQQPQANTYVYASDGSTTLAILRGSQARIIVPSAQISPWVKHAIVAIEDKRFYEHRGVDVHGILRAMWSDVTGGPIQGASTITQQFVKNAYNGNAPTLARKLREAALAWQLEQVWTKDRILTAYLNTIYLGNQAYGVEQASRVYFGHSAANLNPAEAALLAGIPEDPSQYDPVAHPHAALVRRNLVLREMLYQHYLDWAQFRQWKRYKMPDPADVRLPASQSGVAPYFANYVTDQLGRLPEKVAGGGFSVQTTIDLSLQKLARQAVEKVLPASIGPSAALVAIDPHTGAVLAMVGGRNFHVSQFNLAAQGERQPGSSFKPFVLATALSQGISPVTTLTSHPVTINAGGRVWNVHNFEGDDLGPIDLWKAIAYSDNTVFAQLTNLVGPGNVATMSQKLGITTPLQPYFAIGLGAEPATPLEMARAYATLDNGGQRVDGSLKGITDEPRAIQCLHYDTTTHQCKGGENNVVDKPVLSPELAALETSMLQGVVTYGTGTKAQLPGRAVAGKTGTTENYGDAWFVGYTPQLVTAVWVGYPNKLVPMTTEYHGKSVVGGTYPALIWKEFMTSALAYLKVPPESFPSAVTPYGSPVTAIFREGKLERDNGNCRGALTADFFTGDAPTAVANCKPNEVEVPDVRGATLASAQAHLLQQPLLTTLAYRPARPGQRIGVVVDQSPLRGTLSAYDHVRLTLTRATHGVIPSLSGLTLPRARAKLSQLKCRDVVFGNKTGRVVAQMPHAGVAAAPGMTVVLTLRRRPGTGG